MPQRIEKMNPGYPVVTVTMPCALGCMTNYGIGESIEPCDFNVATARPPWPARAAIVFLPEGLGMWAESALAARSRRSQGARIGLPPRRRRSLQLTQIKMRADRPTWHGAPLKNRVAGVPRPHRY